MVFEKKKNIIKLNDLLSNSFTNLRNDILRINQRIDQIEVILASSNLGAMKDFMAFQERELAQIKQFMASCMAAQAESAAAEQAAAQAQWQAQQQVQQEAPQQTQTRGVRIASVQFEADAMHKGNLNGEWVELEGSNMDLTGWTLHDKGNKHKFSFPKGFILNGKVKIYTGKGKNSSKRLFWSNPTPIWNDNDDTATLVDPEGRIANQVRSARTHSFEELI